MLEITMILEWVFLYDVKSYNSNKVFLLFKDTFNISVNYNKSMDVGRQYIHYIAVK